MKIAFSCAIAAAIVLGGLGRADAVVLISTFDADLEGWTVSGGSATHVAAGGNPGGYLAATDLTTTFMTATAPAAFTGDLSSFNGGLISFDAIRLKPTADTQSRFGEISITDGITTATRDLSAALPESWTTFSAPLNAAGWGLGAAAWNTLLSGVTSITLILDSTFGVVEEVGLDNFLIDDEGPPPPVVPEPSSLALLAFGLSGVAGYAARRRKRRVA